MFLCGGACGGLHENTFRVDYETKVFLLRAVVASLGKCVNKNVHSSRQGQRQLMNHSDRENWTNVCPSASYKNRCRGARTEVLGEKGFAAIFADESSHLIAHRPCSRCQS